MGVLTEAGGALASIDAVLADNHTAMCAGAVDRLFAYPDLTDGEGDDLIDEYWSSTYGVMGAGTDGCLDRSPGYVYDSCGLLRLYGCGEDEWPNHETVEQGGVSWTILDRHHPARAGAADVVWGDWAAGYDRAPMPPMPSSGEVWSLAPQWAVFGEALPEVEAAVLRDGGWSIDET